MDVIKVTAEAQTETLLAFAMGTHRRLGNASVVNRVNADVLKIVLEDHFSDAYYMTDFEFVKVFLSCAYAEFKLFYRQAEGSHVLDWMEDRRFPWLCDLWLNGFADSDSDDSDMSD